MSIASQVAYVLRVTCPGLSAEATAIALDIELCPMPAARYRYVAVCSRVEYDLLATPAEQRACIQRAIICHVLDALELQLPRQITIAALAREVFEPTAFGEVLRVVHQG
jgi:hypothetical protein